MTNPERREKMTLILKKLCTDYIHHSIAGNPAEWKKADSDIDQALSTLEALMPEPRGCPVCGSTIDGHTCRKPVMTGRMTDWLQGHGKTPLLGDMVEIIPEPFDKKDRNTKELGLELMQPVMTKEELAFQIFKAWNRFGEQEARDNWTAKHYQSVTKDKANSLASKLIGRG